MIRDANGVELDQSSLGGLVVCGQRPKAGSAFDSSLDATITVARSAC
ncbi:hypothetical protein ACWDO7_17115 [Streptomyces sp. NPDC003656]